MDRGQANRYRGRWKQVEAFELDELRNASVEKRLRIGAALMRMAVGLGRFPVPDQDRDTDLVRARWNTLRRTPA